MSKLTFVLPTCEPETIQKYLIPSLHYLLPIKDYINFAICFQPPYKENELNIYLERFKDFSYKYIYKDYNITKPFVPLIKMRNDCSLLFPDSDYYALLDDDMQFEEGIDKYYLDAINSMDNDLNLSVISFSKRYQNTENCFYTNAGLIYRGGKYYGYEGLIPHKLPNNCKTLRPYEGEDLTELYGGHQDELCAIIRIASGCVVKTYIKVPTTHWENRKIRGNEQHGWAKAEKFPNSVCTFIRKYFNSIYDMAHRNPLFDDKLKAILSKQTYIPKRLLVDKPVIFSLDANKKVLYTEHSTPRVEQYIMNEPYINYYFTVLKAEDYKEFTVLQLHSTDGDHIPIIRISIIEKALYVTYKDTDNINHYTKIDNFEIGRPLRVSIKVTNNSIDINEGKWRYERNFNKYQFRYGIYPQTETGIYELEVSKIELEGKIDCSWELDKYKNITL